MDTDTIGIDGVAQTMALAKLGEPIAGGVDDGACVRLTPVSSCKAPDAPEALTARSFLANAYRATGLYAATLLHQPDVADCERVHGADHRAPVAHASTRHPYTSQ